jgi:hypothetical protein
MSQKIKEVKVEKEVKGINPIKPIIKYSELKKKRLAQMEIQKKIDDKSRKEIINQRKQK